MKTIHKKPLNIAPVAGYTFDKANHVHALDGKPLTGVTTILGVINKPMLIQWAANQVVEYIKANCEIEKTKPFTDAKEHVAYFVSEERLNEAKTAHRKKKEAAGDWGTEVHAEVEKYINNAMICEPSGTIDKTEYDSRITHFITWAKDNKVKFLASEKNIYSKEMWVGGIADIVCEIDGKRFVGDIKTSSGIYPEHFIQASAYAEMLREMGREIAPSPEEVRPELYRPFDGVVIINLKKTGEIDVKFNYDVEGNFNCFKAALTLYRHLNAIKPN